MTEIKPADLIGAVVKCTVRKDGVLNMIRLRLPDGVCVDLWAEGEGGTEGRFVYL